MVAPLLSVTSAGRVPQSAARPTGMAPAAGAQRFSDVLAGERVGGERLPQIAAVLPPEPGTGKSLPDSGRELGAEPDTLAPGGQDTATSQELGDAGATRVDVTAQVAASIEAHVEVHAEVRAEPHAEEAGQEQGVPFASMRAQSRAADASAANASAAKVSAVAGDVRDGAVAAQTSHTQALDGQWSLSEAEPALEPAGTLSPAGPAFLQPLAQSERSVNASFDSASAGGAAPVQMSTASPAAEPADGAAAPAIAQLSAAKRQDAAGMDDGAAVTQVAAAEPAPLPANVQSLMNTIQREAGQALPPAVQQALEAQQRRLDMTPANNAAESRPVTLPGVGAELPPSLASGLSPGRSTDVALEQTRIRLNGVDSLTRPAGGSDSAQALPADDGVLQATLGRGALEGLRTAAGLMPAPGPAQLPAMPPGLSPGLPQGLSQGNAAWGQAISERVLLMTAGNMQVAEIRLDPPELGTLHVRLQLHQDQASLSFSSPHAHVRDALEQQMPRLRDMLAEQGLNLENSSVADDSQRRDRSAPESGSAAGLMAESDDDPTPPAPSVRSAGRSLVDDYA